MRSKAPIDKRYSNTSRYLPQEGCIEYHGMKLFTHNVNGDLISNDLARGVHMEPEIEWLGDLMRPGDVVVDVGACVGTHAMYWSKKVGRSGKIICFEPSQINYLFLSHNVAINKLNNVTTYMTAVGDFNGNIDLHLAVGNCGDNRIWTPPHENREKTSVAITTLDDFLPEDFTFNFLKLDVQGSEVRVLQGAKKTIQRQKHLTLCMEVWPQGLLESGDSDKKLEEVMVELGFHSFLLRKEDNEMRLIEIGQHVAGIVTVESTHFVNIISHKSN